MRPKPVPTPPEAPEIARVYEGRRILITGASGYLGACLRQALMPVKCDIVCVSRSGSPTPAVGRATVIDRPADVSQDNVWDELLEGIDVVFHLAAQTSALVSMRDGLADFKSNALPMLHLLETCRLRKYSPVVVLAGTATEAGITEGLPVAETAADCPITIYDAHKLLAEGYLRSYVESGSLRGTSLRLANVYGPGRSARNDRGVLNKQIVRGLQHETLCVYGSGHQVRDFVFNWDVVSAFLHAGLCIGALPMSHYYIGAGVGRSIVEAVSAVAARVELKTGHRPKVEHVSHPQPQLKIDNRNFVADSNAFRAATGWTTKVNFLEGIDRTIDYFLSDPTRVSRES